jgi:hypothetical protein
MKRGQSRLTSSISSRLCLSARLAEVVVDVGPLLLAHVSGIMRCGSVWACPVCAPVVRGRRARDIDEGVAPWLGHDRSLQGRSTPDADVEPSKSGHGTVLFLTLTLRHHLADGLAGRLAVVSWALRHVLKGAPWKRRKEALGYVGAIRAVEVTYGRNGWHPHLHALLFFERELSARELADLKAWLFGRWGSVCEARGFGSITRANGVDLRPVRASGNELGEYLTKVDGGWGAGLELARADLKGGRRSGSRSPFSILREFLETGDAELLALWKEYEAATFGKRAIVWSRGLRARLGLAAEVSDEEAAAAEGEDVELWLRALVGSKAWEGHRRAGTGGQLLARIEEAAAGGLRGVHRWTEEGS